METISSLVRSNQRGMALTLVSFVILTAATAVFLGTVSPQTNASESERTTQRALAEARRALIGRAAMDDNRPGSLPCPDTNHDGEADLFDNTGANCPSYIGRLPWKTLGLPELRDASGEVLWYALSPSLRDHPGAQPINSAVTPAQIRIVGTEPTLDVAAVVIAPGAVLPGQLREAAGVNAAMNYLEGHNASIGDNIYETAASASAFNDRLLVITRDQLFDVVERRVANEIRNALRRYYTAFRFFPYANSYGDASFACTEELTRGRVPNADLSPTYPLSGCASHADWLPGINPPIAPPQWFAANGWHLLTYYAIAPACTRTHLNCSGSGLLTVNALGGVRAIVIVGGRAISSLGQGRPCLTQTDCIEQPLAAANQYRHMPRSNSFNDRVAVILP
jgi:type II secretory pathway pseudopilin PulG